MDIRLLGSLEVSRDGGAVEVVGATQRRLLAILAVHVNAVVPADRLAHLLWGEHVPSQERNALQVQVFRLRQALEPDRRPGSPAQVVVTRAPGYALELPVEAIDIGRFEQRAAAGRAALAAGDPGKASQLLAEALALWRGPALADFAYDEFARDTITRLEEMRLSVTEDRVDAELGVDHHVAVLAELEALAAAEPLRERRWSQLMLALYRAGRQSDALRAYQTLRRTLADELGVDPGPEVQRLERAILAHDPALDPPTSDAPWTDKCLDVPAPPLLTHAGAPPMVGRHLEIDRLQAAWADAVGGGRTAVFLGGEPGVGKTRLAAEVATQARREGALVLAGRCDEGIGVPYQPFVDALRHLVDHSCDCHLRTRLGRWPRELTRLVPDLAARGFEGAAPPAADPETERYRLFDAVASCLSAAASRQPVLLMLDDVHWATRPTLLLLRHLLRSPDRMRLLVIGTYRDTELADPHPLAELLADLVPAEGVEAVHLTGLDAGSVGQLVAATAGAERMSADPDAWGRTIHGDTKGNPFFVGEVVRHLAETGALDTTVDVPGSVLDLGVPSSVRAVVGRRLSRLAEPTTTVLATAAAVGLEFDFVVVHAACRLDDEVVVATLEEAMAAQLVEEVPGAGTRYRFSHALVRATLYDQMARPRRALVHRRVGEAIEAVHGRHLDLWWAELAHHFAEAAGGAPDARAASYARQAGDQALAQLANDEAVAHYGQALALMDPHASDYTAAVQHCELLISLGEAQRRAGDHGYRQTLLDAAHRAHDLPDPHLLARAALANNRGMFSNAGGVDREVVDVLWAALDAYPAGDSGIRARLLAHLGAELMFSGDWETRMSLSNEALDMARRVGDRHTLVLVLNLRFVTLWTAATLADRTAIAAEAHGLAEGLDDPNAAFHALRFRYHAATEAGDMPAARGFLDAMEAIAAEARQPMLRWYVVHLQAKQAVISGALVEAERLATEAFQIGESLNQPDAIRLLSAQIYTVYFHQHRLGDLVALGEAGFADSFTGSDSLAKLAQMGLASMYCQMDKRDDARRIFDAAMAQGLRDVPDDFGSLPTAALAATVCHTLGDHSRARRLTERLEPFRAQFIDLGSTWFGSAAYYLGLMASVLGNLDEADRHFAFAAEQHTRVGAPVWLAWTQLWWGGMLLRAGDRRGHDLVAEALRSARNLGAAAIEVEAAAALSRG